MQEQQDPDVPEEFMIDPEGAVVDPDLLKFQSQQKKSGEGPQTGQSGPERLAD